MNILLVMVMCSYAGCDSYVIDSGMTKEQCDTIYTDASLQAREPIFDQIAKEYHKGYATSIEALECVQEDTE